MSDLEQFDAVVVGGGPAGATAADDLARQGHKVLLLDKAGRIKPCGGAIPPRLVRDFDIPQSLMVALVRSARIIAPSGKTVTMPIDGGYVGMVDREHFDEWLRERAAQNGAERRTGTFEAVGREDNGTVILVYKPPGEAPPVRVRTKAVIGADGALSKVAKQCIRGSQKMPYVFAYHEIVESPAASEDFQPDRCDVYYDGRLSPDFYGWVFPHGSKTSIGTGSANKGFSLKGGTAVLRDMGRFNDVATVRCEGAPIPLKPLKCWDDGRNVVLAGDACGVVAPASGEGIYYAMYGGRLAAEATAEFLVTGDARKLALARKRFMKAHGRVFFALGLLQKFWYASDKRRERFVSMCADPDVQRLTWQAYMNKELVRSDPMAHIRVMLKDLGHLLGISRVWRTKS
jgi:geranylgeranyl diphosphate/geranylgeranyl-bacteriochlorophyllide a reductase